MPLQILKHPHPVLKEKAKKVEINEINNELRLILDDMRKLMNEAGGIGLAAIQVGIKKRFFIMLENLENIDSTTIVVINPIIIEKNGLINDSEGCLSFPNVTVKVKRATTVKIKCLNEFGKEVEIQREGYLARCIQHEIDHLDGITFFDYLGSLKKQRIEKKYKKLLIKN